MNRIDYTNYDYYKKVKPEELINPSDLTKPFKALAIKAELLRKLGAPKMLVSAMFSLALEIEIGRRDALVIINPENPEPMALTILALNPGQQNERTEIIKVLKKAGWLIKATEKDNFIEISVAEFEPATV